MRYRLADKIFTWAPWRHLRGIKAASFEEYSLREALGYEPALPESLAIGAMLEMGNWLTILSSDFAQMAWTIEIEECRFERVPGPGESLLIDVEMLERTSEHAVFSGRATIESQEALWINSWRAQLLPLDAHYDSSDLRVLYSQITEAP